MKVLIVFAACFVSCASAGALYGPAAPLIAAAGPVLANTGSSTQFRSEDNYGNYQFGYDESHATGSSGRREERSGDVVRGSYRLGDADGRQRTVNYVADAAGFRATVHTNEPGVDPARDPADVLINKEAIAVAPAPLLAAPAPLPAPILAAPAPIYHSAPLAVQAPLVQAPLAAPIVAQAPIYEAPAPRAFSYSFGSAHPSIAYGQAPLLTQAY